MTNLDLRAREVALRRVTSQTTRHPALEAANAEASDWVGHCRFCNTSLNGTQLELADHICAEYLETLDD